MANAIRSKDLPGWAQESQKRDDAHRDKVARGAVFKGKKFSQLNTSEKDALLQEVAIRLGLIKE